jgi:selenide,water dikinase
MGGTPLAALSVVCYPLAQRGVEELEAILRGASSKLSEAAVPILGGHSVDDLEPKYGLAVTGTIHPDHIATNAGATGGDVIVLTKPLGTGIITTAAKSDACTSAELSEACRWMAALNDGAARAMRSVGIGADSPVHAATDITGFGLLGHLYRLAVASSVSLSIEVGCLPLMPGVERLAADGHVTRGDTVTRAYLGDALLGQDAVSTTRLSAMLDPQTSGGLAICVRGDAVLSLLEALSREGVAGAVIGQVEAACPPRIELR